MKHTYFVSYHIKTDDGWGFGMVSIDMRRGINTMADVLEIAEQLKKDLNCAGVVVLNWKEIDAAPPGDPQEKRP